MISRESQKPSIDVTQNQSLLQQIMKIRHKEMLCVILQKGLVSEVKL